MNSFDGRDREKNPRCLYIAALSFAALFVWSHLAYGNGGNGADHYGYSCDNRIVLDGPIEYSSVLYVLKVLELCEEKVSIISIRSPGGSSSSALAIAYLMLKYNMDVEVTDYCGSSCANYIFPAGNKKYVSRSALIYFHGGVSWQDGEIYHREHGAHSGIEICSSKMESVFTFDFNSKSGRSNFQRFVESHDCICGISEEECLNYYVSLEEKFYSIVGVNKHIAHYGLIGDYESDYMNSESRMYYYTPDSYQRLGVDNIILIDKVWEPRKDWRSSRHYEVEYKGD